MFGNRCIKTYSQTQETIALSSGDSECLRAVKAAMGLGVKGLTQDSDVGVEAQANAVTRAQQRVQLRGEVQDEYDTLKYESLGCKTGWHKESLRSRR